MTDSAMIIGTWVKLLKKLKRSTTFHALEKNASKAWQAMVMVRFHCVFIGSNWIMLNYRYYFWIGNYFIVLNTWSLQLTFWYKPDSFEYLNISLKGHFGFFFSHFFCTSMKPHKGCNENVWRMIMLLTRFVDSLNVILVLTDIKMLNMYVWHVVQTRAMELFSMDRLLYWLLFQRLF